MNKDDTNNTKQVKHTAREQLKDSISCYVNFIDHTIYARV